MTTMLPTSCVLFIKLQILSKIEVNSIHFGWFSTHGFFCFTEFASTGEVDSLLSSKSGTMPAVDVSLILELGEFWKIWWKTHDTRDDYEQTAQSLLASLRCWTQLIVENVAPLAAPGKKGEYFPYNRRKVNEWFKFDIKDKDSGEIQSQVNIIHVNKEGQTSKCYTQDVDKFPKPCDQHEVFYHGTTAAHATRIMDGIDLSAGKPKKDFSDGDGFYLTDKLHDVWPNVKWSRQRPPCSTVLIFKIRKQDLRDSDLRGLNLTDLGLNGSDLTEDEKEMRSERWQEIVSTFRNGKADYEFKRTLNADFIEGPLCGDETSADVRGGKRYTPTTIYQLCVRSERCVALFDRGLFSVLVFDN